MRLYSTWFLFAVEGSALIVFAILDLRLWPLYGRKIGLFKEGNVIEFCEAILEMLYVHWRGGLNG